jgi:CubicO group peptidase (beta-lactamase class C family)
MALNRRDWLQLASMTAAAGGLSGEVAQAAIEAEPNPAPPPPAPRAVPAPKAVAVVDHPGAGHEYTAALKALCQYVDAHRAAYGLPGMTVSVADAEGFKAVITAGWSDIDRREPVTPEHVFQIGSISKSFAGLVTLRLVDAGKLNLDTEVRELLPQVPLPDGVRITVRHLLTHTSGLAEDPPLFPRDGSETLWLGFTPGTQFSYSNLGYELLGLIAEHLEQAPYPEVLARVVLAPLGLSAVLPQIKAADRPRYAASYNPYYTDRPFPRGGRLVRAPWVNLTAASGCVAATARQMADYVRWLIQAGRGKGDPLLSEASRQAFLTPAVTIPIFGPGAHYAFGLALLPIDGHDCLHHTGGMLSFVSAITVDPTAGDGAFASVNASTADGYRPIAVTRYAIQLLRAAREGKPLPPPAAIEAPTRFEGAKALAGHFRSSDGETLELIVSGDGLALEQSGVRRPLQPGDDEGSFIVVGPGEESSALLVRTHDGAVRSVGWGAKLYTPEGQPPLAPLPRELQRLAGIYESDDPWNGQHEIVARPDGVWLDGTEPLTLLNDGSFRVGHDDWSPDRIRFDGDLDGRPSRLSLSGVDFMRRR